jgi:hypothetical protein
MAEAIRTRCKFKCIGVEDTEYEVGNVQVLETENPEEFAALDGPEGGVYQSGKLALKYKIRHSGKFAQNVRFAAQYDPNKSEDVSFAEATPSGELKIYVSNPAVVGTFKPGREYYLDLIPVA